MQDKGHEQLVCHFESEEHYWNLLGNLMEIVKATWDHASDNLLQKLAVWVPRRAHESCFRFYLGLMVYFSWGKAATMTWGHSSKFHGEAHVEKNQLASTNLQIIWVSHLGSEFFHPSQAFIWLQPQSTYDCNLMRAPKIELSNQVHNDLSYVNPDM